MAEFCLDCWNQIMGSNDPPGKYILSREPELCEECREWKPVIIRVKRRYIVAEWFCEQIGHFAKGRRK